MTGCTAGLQLLRASPHVAASRCTCALRSHPHNVISNKRRSQAARQEDRMRLAQHLFYALAALVGVTLVAMKDPSLAVAVRSVEDPAPACRSDHLERACEPGLQVAGVLQDGQVIAR